MQLIETIDLIFKKRKLKLKLTPYEILSTGENCGLVEFISDSFSLDYINKKTNVDLDMFYKYAF
jgi:phosphatidylinositol 4-kinase